MRGKVACSIALVLAGCHGAPSVPPDAGPDAATGIPVSTAAVSRETLQDLVSGPGRTDAIEQQKVTAPFRGTLKQLLVVDGDHVTTGQIIGSILSQNSEAAIAGAVSMRGSAGTPTEKHDAERALAIARSGAIAAPLRAPEAGVVVSHGASEGDLVNDQQPIVSIAETDSIVFIASIVQTDLARIQPQQSAAVDVASRDGAVRGSVHGILPSASPADLRAPVRIDFEPPQPSFQLGLFGTVHIVVAEHSDATVVPSAAVLRDDVHGTTRVAFVDSSGHAHWRDVVIGLVQKDKTEIVSPPLSGEGRVIVSGQVGLAEGALVAPSP